MDDSSFARARERAGFFSDRPDRGRAAEFRFIGPHGLAVREQALTAAEVGGQGRKARVELAFRLAGQERDMPKPEAPDGLRRIVIIRVAEPEADRPPERAGRDVGLDPPRPVRLDDLGEAGP
jgi:hypothetical protein